MSDKWIPNGHSDCVVKVESFARTIARDPARFGVSPEDSQTLTAAVARYREAHQAAESGGRSGYNGQVRKQARGEAVKIVTRLKKVISADDKLDAATKILLDIRQHKKGGTALPCPQEPPKLRFIRALHEGSGVTPMHELDFRALDWKSKPPGAVRLELFVDLTPPDEPIPAHPGANHGSRPWYLRSYTRSPIKLIPPMARVPMRVVYWGRWADSQGNVGPFSTTAAAWIEGGSHQLLPGGTGMTMGGINGPKPVPILEDAGAPGPAGRNATYIVAVLEAQHQAFNPQEITPPALPPMAERETRQLEGPASEAA